MPDITLFEADLSGSKFVAPFGHYHEGEEYQSEEDEEGRNWKLLAGLTVVVGGVLGGVAVFLKRKFAGDDGAGDGAEDDEFEAEGRFGFDEEFDVEGETDADDEFEPDRERGVDGSDSESRKGAVAAVVGLLFLILVTALVKRRGGDDTAEVEVDVEEPDRTTAAERER